MASLPLIDLEWLVLGLQAQARALTDQIATLGAHIEVLVDHVAAAAEAERPAPQAGGAGCQHPDDFRIDAGSLRAPRRFFCKACRCFIEPAADSDAVRSPRAELTTQPKE